MCLSPTHRKWQNWDLKPGLSGRLSYVLSQSALPPLEPQGAGQLAEYTL